MKPLLQHLSIPRPVGSEEITRAFYGDLLGLKERSVPLSIQHLDLIWFDLGNNVELHVFAETPTDDTSRRHFCLAVEDVVSIRAKLLAAGYQPWDPEVIPGRPRFFCRDPFNNIIEFTQIVGDYLELEKQE